MLLFHTWLPSCYACYKHSDISDHLWHWYSLAVYQVIRYLLNDSSTKCGWISVVFCAECVQLQDFKPRLTTFFKRIGGVMVSALASSAVDRGFEPRPGQTKDYKICICCFSGRHAALRRRSKDWLSLNQDNVFEWADTSTRGLLFQWNKRVGLVESGPHHHLIEHWVRIPLMARCTRCSIMW